LRAGIGDASWIRGVTAPCGGSFGLPKVIAAFSGAALAAVMLAAATTPPTAVAANISRLEIMALPPVGMVGHQRLAGVTRVTSSPQFDLVELP
jgi:hypothetical protein